MKKIHKFIEKELLKEYKQSEVDAMLSAASISLKIEYENGAIDVWELEKREVFKLKLADKLNSPL